MGALPNSSHYAGGLPWQAYKGGYTLLDPNTTGEAMLIEAEMNWNLEKSQALYCGADGVMHEYPGHYTVARTDTGQPFGQVQGQYVIVQNPKAFQIPDVFVNDGLCGYTAAGQYFGGRYVWSQAKMGSTFITKLNGEEQQFDHYLLFVNVHGGHGSVIMGRSTVKVASESVYDAQISGATNRIKMNHTNHVENRIEEAYANFAKLTDGITDEMSLVQDLENVEMKVSAFRSFAGAWLTEIRGAAKTKAANTQRERAVDTLEEMFVSGKGNYGVSAGDAFGAVADFLDHTKKEYETEAEANSAADRLTNSTLFGDNFKAKGAALARLALDD